MARLLEENPYSNTKTGLLGDQRDTMLINEVLRKLSAMRGWPDIQLGKQKSKSAPRERDFIAMNTAATQSGIVTAKEVNSFFKMHDIRKKVPKKSTTKSKSFESMVHGVKSRCLFLMSFSPSTPISYVIEHKYQTDYINEMYNKKHDKDGLLKKVIRSI
ncbi:cilia- and flagella-associated protein 77-like [Octopus sinensis]|uniref:Cilia- and flagella-associated protein 77-like n=1 Tax=Octopus sinensis TaxID=2607531 RepID=A0A6P7TT86_9MOLL|nr:cilia- and flagella-associated protein 77-like [Octopus sinensis]